MYFLFLKIYNDKIILRGLKIDKIDLKGLNDNLIKIYSLQ